MLLVLTLEERDQLHYLGCVKMHTLLLPSFSWRLLWYIIPHSQY